MCGMAIQKTSLSVDRDLHAEMKELAKRKNRSLTEIYNEALKNYLHQNNGEVLDEIYAPILNRHMDRIVKAFENRLASLLAKTGHDAAATLFVSLETLRLVREGLDMEELPTNQLYDKARRYAVQQVGDRDEFLKNAMEEWEEWEEE